MFVQVSFGTFNPACTFAKWEDAKCTDALYIGPSKSLQTHSLTTSRREQPEPQPTRDLNRDGPWVQCLPTCRLWGSGICRHLNRAKPSVCCTRTAEEQIDIRRFNVFTELLEDVGQLSGLGDCSLFWCTKAAVKVLQGMHLGDNPWTSVTTWCSS